MGGNDAFRIVIEDFRVTLQIVVSLTEDSRGIIYDHTMFIVQATIRLLTIRFYKTKSSANFSHSYNHKSFLKPFKARPTSSGWTGCLKTH
jgi:hypothetical protein